MIQKQEIIDLVDQFLLASESESYLIDVTVSRDNQIVITLDNDEVITLDECTALNQYINEHLDRDKEDFELEVGSAGLGQPFKVPQQYINFIGKEVEVLDADGKKTKGILKAVDGNEFVVTTKVKVTPEGKKRPVLTDVDKTFGMDQVKYTKYIISFK